MTERRTSDLINDCVPSRTLLEQRLLITDSRQLRLEKVRSTKKPGVTTEGCPIAKYVSDHYDLSRLVFLHCSISRSCDRASSWKSFASL